jgi:hypothetical protein
MPLVAGVVTTSNVSSTGVVVTTTTATGGTAPYTYQFQQASDAGGSPGVWSNIGTDSAARSITVTGLTNATIYWFRCVVTDAAPASANSDSASDTTTTPVVVSYDDVKLTVKAA